MSGGHFDYIQFKIDEAATHVDWILKNYDYSPEVVAKFNEAYITLRKAAVMLNRIDWLVSGDDGPESFLRRWDEDLENT